MKFKVGDKVYRMTGYLNNLFFVGTVIAISEKRGDITVQFGPNKEKYNKEGLQVGVSSYSSKIQNNKDLAQLEQIAKIIGE